MLTRAMHDAADGRPGGVGCVNSVTPDLPGDSTFAADALRPQVRRVRRGPPAKAPPSQVAVPLTWGTNSAAYRIRSLCRKIE
jgi:hypothetical protein